MAFYYLCEDVRFWRIIRYFCRDNCHAL